MHNEIYMNNKALLLFFFLLLAAQLPAQITISGFVKTTREEPLAGASISIENSYSGTTSSADGSFSFLVTDTGTVRIVVSITGYKPFEQVISLGPSAIV